VKTVLVDSAKKYSHTSHEIDLSLKRLKKKEKRRSPKNSSIAEAMGDDYINPKS